MLLVGGENLIDLISNGSQDSKLSYQAVAGGSPYNTAIAAGRSSAKVAYITPISNDHFGQLLCDHLLESGVKCLGSRVEEATSLAVVNLVQGQATYQFYRSHTADRQINSADLSGHLEQASMLHIGSLALTGDIDGEQWCQLFERAQSRLFTSVDLNIRPRFVHSEAQYRKRLKRVMKSAQLIKLSDEDLEWWSAQGPLSDEEQAVQCQQLWKDYQPKILILTRGSSGSSLWFDNKSMLQRIDTPVVRVRDFRDTVGAGDTFMGSFLALLQQQVLDEFTHISKVNMIKILQFASTAASLNCERTGCQPPSFDQVLDRLAKI